MLLSADPGSYLTLALLSCEGSILGCDAVPEEHYITPLCETWNQPSDEGTAYEDDVCVVNEGGRRRRGYWRRLRHLCAEERPN